MVLGSLKILLESHVDGFYSEEGQRVENGQVVFSYHFHMRCILCVSEHLQNFLDLLVREDLKLIVLLQLIHHDAFDLSGEGQTRQFRWQAEASALRDERSCSREQDVRLILFDRGAKARIHTILFRLNLHAAEKNGHLTVFVEGVREDGATCDSWPIEMCDKVLCLLDNCHCGVIQNIFFAIKVTHRFLIVECACFVGAWHFVKQILCLKLLFAHFK